jgi:hypothetical protein
LFLYFFELVLRTPCKPRPFPRRETFFVQRSARDMFA